ncbi:MAG: S41 family peptidase [Sphaerochaetaceae bacterium]
MKKLSSIILVLFSLLAFCGQVAAAGGISEQLLPTLYNQNPSKTKTASDEISVNMQKLELLYRLVDRDFLFEIDDNAVYESMAKGLFAALGDEYSTFVIATEAADFSTDTTGNYGGIGAYISKPYLEYQDATKPETYMVSITSVFPGSPAQQAGLRSGDLLSHIDGISVQDYEADDASKALKGAPDTPVVLTVLRGTTTFEVTVIRKIVSIPTVSETILEDTIGYLRITQFTNSTGTQVLEVMEKFAEMPISALIIDLRDNPGGIVDSALAVADMLLSDQTIVHINSKDPAKEFAYVASSETQIPASTPVVVLTNKGSASSSEILSGALKDNQRATLIGSTTYGKGLIQLVSPFGDGYYTLTNSQYRTPNGNDIHKIGIVPDIEVEELTIADEDMDAYVEFVNSGVLTDFVDNHPGYSEENLALFLTETAQNAPKLDPQIYRLLLRREYLYAMPYDDRPIADPQFDLALERAIEFIKTGTR